mmetsp:Transcript_50666/g.144779  ORF Transcript_50666/g.144779 Transcript_50666/m.144779 type:complete len:100 (-) Transcript_50666:2-301(-)
MAGRGRGLLFLAAASALAFLGAPAAAHEAASSGRVAELEEELQTCKQSVTKLTNTVQELNYRLAGKEKLVAELTSKDKERRARRGREEDSQEPAHHRHV